MRNLTIQNANIFLITNNIVIMTLIGEEEQIEKRREEKSIIVMITHYTLHTLGTPFSISNPPKCVNERVTFPTSSITTSKLLNSPNPHCHGPL